LFPFTLAAQPPAAIGGAVLDSSGGVIVGATVTLKAGPAEERTVTDSNGRFLFDRVPAGAASVTATFDGFSPATVEVAGPRTDVRVVLQPVPLFEDVVVSGTLDRIRTATKTDMPVRDVPQAITVVTKDTMTELNMTGIGDVVRYVPGF
jgi:outer membrane receptor for monomeric catechols